MTVYCVWFLMEARERASDLLKMKLESVVSYLVLVLGTELGPSARAVLAFRYWAISPAQKIHSYLTVLAYCSVFFSFKPRTSTFLIKEVPVTSLAYSNWKHHCICTLSKIWTWVLGYCSRRSEGPVPTEWFMGGWLVCRIGSEKGGNDCAEQHRARFYLALQ